MIRPKKHWGQHFLTDKNIARKIVDSLHPGTKNLLEIGPGTGILTAILLDSHIENYKVIEIDKESVDYIRSNYPQISDEIIFGDFLKFDATEIFTEKFSVIGNFPYNISSQILFRILEFRKQVDQVVGMFQKEVAERIVSLPGKKTYGILSVLLQAFYNIEYLFTVNEHVFYPSPNVKSAVIRMQRNEADTLNCDENLFFNLVKSGFNQRRKTLRNSLGKFSFKVNDNTAELLRKRAEQLSVADFILLAQSIASA
jgi:16S rRNA (adenine1518-N6/adenine1519-N6)-dimethyltransferase